MPDNALSVTLDGAPDLPSAVLQALYRITGRSSVELRRSILRREPLFTAALFGNEHIHVVPRWEKTISYLEEIGIPFTLSELVDGEWAEVSRETVRNILEGADGQFS